MRSSLLQTWAFCGMVWAALAASPFTAGALPRHHKGKIAPGLAEILARMNEAAKRLKTLTANVEFTTVTVVVNDKSTEYGQLFFHKSKNPEILIKFDQPTPKTILVKKNKAEMYLPKINQIQEYNLEHHKELVQQFFLLGFGTETGELKKTYNIRFVDEEDLNGDTSAVLELTPRKESEAEHISKVLLWVSEESWLPVQQKIVEPGGDYHLAGYRAVKVNRQLPSSTFELSSAKGAKRVKMN